MAQATSAIEATTPEYRMVDYGNVTPSKTNPRTRFDDNELRQLADSIAEKGIIEPLIVRPWRGQLEIVAGERRYRAAGLSQQTHLPCIIRSLTDEQALEIQLIENLHRQDLSPLEEAAGFRALIKTNPDKHSATTIAERVGKSPSWVWDLMKLLDLVPEARKLLDEGRMTVNHAIPIARLKPGEQKQVIDPDDGGLFTHEHVTEELPFSLLKEKTERDPYEEVKTRTVRELNEWIHDHIRFDVNQAAKAAPLLFEKVAEQVGEASARPGRGKKVVSITRDHYVQPSAKNDERIYTERSWKRADGTEKTTLRYPNKWLDSPVCGHSVLGVVVVGPGQGETFDVCIARDRCEVHWGKELKEKAKRQKQGETPKAESKWEAQRRREDAEREKREERWKAFGPALKKATYAALDKVPATLPKAAYQQLLKTLQLPLNTKLSNLPQMLLRKEVNGAFSYMGSYGEPRMVAWANSLGVDIKALEPVKRAVQTAGAKAKAKGKKQPAKRRAK